MKFSIEREQLLPALQVIGGVVERRQTLPILANTLLMVDEGQLSLTATDMEVELVVRLALEGGAAGETTLPARKLLDICRTLPDAAELNFDIEGDRAKLKSGRSRFTLASLPAQEFPATEVTEFSAQFSISQGVLRQLLEDTQFAMAQQDVRYYLNGLLLELSPDNLRTVATDGHRLAMSEASVGTGVETPVQIIIPRKGVQELLRLLESSDEEITLQVSSNHIRIDTGRIQFTSKLIDGRFPDYQRVIPAPSSNILVTDRDMLRQSLTRASILSNEKYRGIRLVLQEGMLRALAHNPEQEEAEEEIEVEYSGDEIEIGFNVSYLLDALGAIRTKRVQAVFADASSSCLILPDGDSQNSKYVVMPMRL
ncbi:MAG: DNA polymerase III subunit beta [Gammaproteobacteria bacterium]|nr:DNA polymerase III subunit beta [Gammaproteobacteria bacterium]